MPRSPGGTRPPFSTRPNYTEYNITTTVDEEGKRFVIVVPFADPELPYYPVLVAAMIMGRSPGSAYNALGRNTGGLEGVQIEGVAHVEHSSLVKYLQNREASAASILERKRQALTKMPKRAPRRKPRMPRPQSATLTAQAFLDTGEMDFLQPIVDQLEVAHARPD